MEILRVLSSPDLDVRRKALGLAMEMVSSKNVEEVILLLKKELGKTVDEQYEKVRVVYVTGFDMGLHDYRTTSTDHFSYTPSINVPSSSRKSQPTLSAY